MFFMATNGCAFPLPTSSAPESIYQLQPLGLTRQTFAATGVWTNRTGRNYAATLTPEYL